MKKEALKKWIERVLPWGWSQLLRFNLLLKKKPHYENPIELIQQKAMRLKINAQVEMSMHSFEAPSFPSEIEDWKKKIQEDSLQRFLLGNLLSPLVLEVENKAAVIQCKVEQGVEKKRIYVLALYPFTPVENE